MKKQINFRISFLRSNWFFLLAISYFTILTAWGQTKSGTIYGQISDDFGTLPGAQITVKGTTIGAATNLSGDYVLDNLAPGSYTLVISYLGFKTVEEDVTIQSGENMLKDYIMTQSSTELGEVIVNGVREGQYKALNQQRNADNIKQVVSLDLMGRFPDLNVAEALQRLPGVTIGRERGEGADVQLRGTPAGFTNININGEQIMGTQEEGNRNAQLDVIPIDVLSSMEVVKTLTPDLDGDAIAGVVNMRTPTASTLKAKGAANLGVGYNNLREKPNAIGNLSYGQRFFADEKVPMGRLGIIASGSYFRTKNGRDRIEAQSWETVDVGGENGEVVFPTDFRYRYLESIRTRTGFSATVDYKFNPSSFIIANVMVNNRDDDDIRYRRRFRMDDPEIQEDGSYFDDRARAYNQVLTRTQDVKNANYSLQGETRLGKSTLDAAVFYTDSRRDYNSDAVSFNSGRFPMINRDINTSFLRTEGEFNDSSLYSLNNFESNDVVTHGNNTVFRVNLSIPYRLGSGTGKIKAGLKSKSLYNERYRPNSSLYSEFSGDTSVLLTDFVGTNELSDSFMDNNLNFGPNVSTSAIDYYYSNPNNFTTNVDASRISADTFFYEATENVFAGYLMSQLQLEKLMILIGARIEKTNVDYSANIVEQDGETWVSTTPINSENNYTKILPNIQFKYNLNQSSIIRAALTFGYSRPNFADLVPSRSIGIESQEITIGNPDLDPAFSTNLDLMYEKYFDDLGIFSGGIFYKNIDKFQYTSQTSVIGNEFTGASVYTDWVLHQTLNGETAKVFGLELNYQKNLTFLPGILSGLSIYTNYTYTNSNADTQDRKDLNLPGQAPHSANGTLSFAYKKYSIKGSANYNGTYVLSLGANDEEDITRDNRLQIDLNATYQLSKNWTIYTEALNLTNAAQFDYFGDKSRVYQKEFYSWWGRMGVKYRF